MLVFDDENNEVILEQNESIYYNLISNTLDKTTLEIDCDKDKFYITINDYKTKYKWKDNKFQINIKLDTKINTYNCKYDLNKKESVNKEQKNSEKTDKEKINNIIEEAKQKGKMTYGDLATKLNDVNPEKMDEVFDEFEKGGIDLLPDDFDEEPGKYC